MNRKILLIGCVLGVVVCLIKILPLENLSRSYLPGDAVLIFISILLIYVAGYCLYRIGLALYEYFTYSDFQ